MAHKTNLGSKETRGGGTRTGRWPAFWIPSD